MSDSKNYLPSKKFQAIVLIIVVFIALFFTIKGVVSLFKSKSKVAGEPIQMTVGTLIQKDGNNNGIADWEEYLWGLDPNKNGPENKEFILAKKKTLEQNGIISIDDSSSITENEILSRQFFSTIMSLQQTGELDTGSIQSVADAVGQQIEATPIADIYTKSMLTIEADSPEAKLNYFTNFINLADKYKKEDIGSELIIISQGISNNDAQALASAQSIASAYRNFGAELIKIPVPSEASFIILELANNYEKTALSIEGLTKTLTDPIIGMRAIINYKQYNDALVSDIEKLSEVLQ